MRVSLANNVRWVASVLCGISLTGCPQLERDDFRIMANSANAGLGGERGDAGNDTSGEHTKGTGGASSDSTGGATSAGGTFAEDTSAGGTFAEVTSAGGTSAGGTSAGGTSAGDDTSAGGTSAEDTGGATAGDTSTGGTHAGEDASVGGTAQGGTSVGGSGGLDNTGGAGSSSSTAALCVLGPFESAEMVTGLNVNGQLWGPTLSTDGTTLFFEMVENNYNHIYVASRKTRGAEFSPATLVAIDGAPSIQASPFLSADGKSLYFTTSTVYGSTDRDIWVASRTDTTLNAFSGAKAVTGVNTTSAEARPWLSSDGITMLLASARVGGSGDNDIWMATKSSTTLLFGTVTNLTAVNGRYRDGSAILSKDGLTVYFASTRGSSGTGELDIWTATRSTTERTDFGTPTALTGINTTSKETDPALSSDETELFFVSDRSGSAQLWRATRSCTPAQP